VEKGLNSKLREQETIIYITEMVSEIEIILIYNLIFAAVVAALVSV